uniref:Receptor ligand binding region domain-containing protein n=1 Tax=Lates calcarifer TaxID=8187 RepID=A0A4W6C5G7_LATCA
MNKYLFYLTSLVQLSHFATCACLSNREEFPTFFRTIPSDLHQSRALAKLVKLFGWTWVGAISNKNDYGNNGIATFIQAAQEEGVCIEYYQAFEQTGPPRELTKVVETVRHSTSKVIVAFMSHREVNVLATELYKQNITGLQWVGSDAWITDHSLTDSEGHSILEGSLGFAVSRAKIPGLEEHLRGLHPSQFPDSQFVRDFWEHVFDCSLNDSTNAQKKPCSGSESLQNVQSYFTDVSELRFTNNVYKSVYSVAHALHNLVTCEERNGPLYSGSCTDPKHIQPWQVRKKTKRSLTF